MRRLHASGRSRAGFPALGPPPDLRTASRGWQRFAAALFMAAGLLHATWHPAANASVVLAEVEQYANVKRRLEQALGELAALDAQGVDLKRRQAATEQVIKLYEELAMLQKRLPDGTQLVLVGITGPPSESGPKREVAYRENAPGYWARVAGDAPSFMHYGSERFVSLAITQAPTAIRLGEPFALAAQLRVRFRYPHDRSCIDPAQRGRDPLPISLVASALAYGASRESYSSMSRGLADLALYCDHPGRSLASSSKGVVETETSFDLAWRADPVPRLASDTADAYRYRVTARGGSAPARVETWLMRIERGIDGARQPFQIQIDIGGGSAGEHRIIGSEVASLTLNYRAATSGISLTTYAAPDTRHLPLLGQSAPSPVASAPDPAALDRSCDTRLPGTKWFTDPQTGKGGCFCIEGHWWSEPRKRCLTWQAFAEDFCNTHHSGRPPAWDDRPGGAYRCACPAGSSWNAEQRRCDGAQEYARNWCASRYAGTEPKFKDATAFDCLCPAGSWLNSRVNRCMPFDAFAEDDCAARYPGTRPRWTGADRWNCESARDAAPAPAYPATAPAVDCAQSMRQARETARVDSGAARIAAVGVVAAGCDFGSLQQAIAQGESEGQSGRVAPQPAPPPLAQPRAPVPTPPPLFGPTTPSAAPPPAQLPVPAAAPPAQARPPAPRPQQGAPASRCVWEMVGNSLLGTSENYVPICFCNGVSQRGSSEAACGPRPR